MNLFQNNEEKSEFILTEFSEIDSDEGGYTLVASSDDYSITDETLSDELIAAIEEYGGDNVAGGYSVQVI
ncbi:hypothetical protein [Klebsiella pneumoniae]|uniref:hypothetical protein n=1 Tax=Klebsiella pneumoniae TaxID=573 RepID=UPI003B25D75C